MSGVIWQSTPYKVNKVIHTFGDGLNTYSNPFEIGDGEMTYCDNVYIDNDYPAVRNIPSNKFFANTPDYSTNIRGLGVRNDEQLHMTFNNTWQYFASPATTTGATILTTTLSTSADVEFDEFVTGTNRYTIMMNSTQKLYWDGTSTCATLGDANTPATRLFAVHSGRIFAVTNNEIKFSALNLINDWTTANDAGSISVTNAKGAINAICSHADRVIVFTNKSMHFLYGTSPSDFQVIDSEHYVGCVSQRSIVKHSGYLYWAANDGFYRMEGSIPERISDPVVAEWNKILFKSRISGGYKGDYVVFFCHTASDATAGTLFLYNIHLNKWFTTQNKVATEDFVNVGDILYLEEVEGIYKYADSTVPSIVGWSFETKAYNDGTISGKKSLSKIHITAQKLSTGDGRLDIRYSSNAESGHTTSSFTFLGGSTNDSTAGTVTLTSNPTHFVINPPPSVFSNVDYYRLGIFGYSDVKIYNVELEYRIRT